MKSRIAIALATLSLAFGLSACVAESGEDLAAEETAATAEPASRQVSAQVSPRVSADALGNPTTQTEYTYFRCSLNGGLYTTRSFCLESCAGGTCRLIIICKNAQGQQIPCP